MRQLGILLLYGAVLAAISSPAVAGAGVRDYDHYSDAARARSRLRRELKPAYAEQLEAGEASALVDAILAEAPGEQEDVHIQALGTAMRDLCDERDDAKEPFPAIVDGVIDGLLAEGGPVAASTAAELVLGILPLEGRGHLEARAAELLDHEDPFVAGIAEWAIATCVELDNYSKDIPPQWPPQQGGGPEWFEKWRAKHGPEAFARWDHVRQAASQGIHRDAAALQESARRAVERAEGLLEYARAEGLDGLGTAEEAVDAARQAVAMPEDTDLLRVRRNWLRVRKQTRKAILAVAGRWCPRLAYVQRRNFVGQHNISGNSQHQDKVPPPSDILVRQGLGMSAEPRSLLGDRLPQGAIRGADIFFDGERITFSYAEQPPEFWEHWPGNYWQPGRQNYERPKGGGRPQKIYEINVDGTGLRKLTKDEIHVDMEPTYVPDGSVVFASDRGHGASECGGWVQNATVLNLFRVFPEDGHIERLTWNKDYDRYPHVLNNGQIGYLRWDYQERGIMQPHTLWGIRPDGTQNDALYKQHMAQPYSLRDAMPIPGADRLIAIGTGHHHCPEGWPILLEPDAGINDPDGMKALAMGCSDVQGGLPNDLRPVEEGGVVDSPALSGGWYQTPRALSEKAFLISHCNGRAVSARWKQSFSWDLYYVDVWGNKELIARDPYMELAYPMVAAPRPSPPDLPDVTDPDTRYAVCYVHDVYSDMPGVEKGEVKHIRISHRTDWINRKDGHGTFRWYPHYAAFSRPTFGYWTWCGTRVIGTVPVREDGSAYFKVPVHTPVYFQALDENLMEVRRMRSHVEFQPGERRGCLGCHESREQTGPNLARAMPQALLEKPDHPRPPAWGATRMIDFEEIVHPVLERRCAGCHGADDPPKGVEFTAHKDGFGYVQSYRSLFGVKRGDPLPQPAPTANWYAEKWPEYRPEQALSMGKQQSRDWWDLVYEGRAPGQLVSVLNHRGSYMMSEPKAFGSHRSKFLLHLIEDAEHRRIVRKMPRDEWEALTTWVDAGAPYSGKMILKYDEEGKPLARVMPVDVQYPDPWERPTSTPPWGAR